MDDIWYIDGSSHQEEHGIVLIPENCALSASALSSNNRILRGWNCGQSASGIIILAKTKGIRKKRDMTNYFLFYFEPHVKALNAFQRWRVFAVEVLQADRPVRVAVVIKKVCEVEEGDFCIGSCFVYPTNTVILVQWVALSQIRGVSYILDRAAFAFINR